MHPLLHLLQLLQLTALPAPMRRRALRVHRHVHALHRRMAMATEPAAVAQLGTPHGHRLILGRAHTAVRARRRRRREGLALPVGAGRRRRGGRAAVEEGPAGCALGAVVADGGRAHPLAVDAQTAEDEEQRDEDDDEGGGPHGYAGYGAFAEDGVGGGGCAWGGRGGGRRGVSFGGHGLAWDEHVGVGVGFFLLGFECHGFILFH